MLRCRISVQYYFENENKVFLLRFAREEALLDSYASVTF